MLSKRRNSYRFSSNLVQLHTFYYSLYKFLGQIHPIAITPNLEKVFPQKSCFVGPGSNFYNGSSLCPIIWVELTFTKNLSSLVVSSSSSSIFMKTSFFRLLTVSWSLHNCFVTYHINDLNLHKLGTAINSSLINLVYMYYNFTAVYIIRFCPTKTIHKTLLIFNGEFINCFCR